MKVTFGVTHKRKRGRGVSVFGLLKQNGKVYAAIIPDAKTKTLMSTIREQVKLGSMF